MRDHNFISDNIYHIYNRGVAKLSIFWDQRFYTRFIKGLIIYNDARPCDNSEDKFKTLDPKLDLKDDNRELLVDILAFCLMPNHFHLLLRQRVDNGITKFMRKLGVGYANYSNLMRDRNGALFQGRFKSVPVEYDAYLAYMPHYIHLNPLDLSFPEWRTKTLKSKTSATKFLESYEWSSFSDYYLEKPKFPSLTQRNTIVEYFNESGGYKINLDEFLKDLDLTPIKERLLEPSTPDHLT